MILHPVSMHKVCKETGVSYRKVQNWLQDEPEAQMMYLRAKPIQMEAFVDKIIRLSGRRSRNMLEANDKRIGSDNYKWLAAKLAPKTYGDITAALLSQALERIEHLERKLEEREKRGA